MAIIKAKTAKPRAPSARTMTAALRKLADAAADSASPARKFDKPLLPKGVVPRGGTPAIAMDDALQSYAFLNQAGNPACGMGFPGYAYLSQLAQRSEYRSPAEVMANEMTRRWLVITGAEPEREKELSDAMKAFRLREIFHDAALSDCLMGCAHIVPEIKGQDTDAARELPLLLDANGAGVRKGSLIAFRMIEPMWATPLAFNSNDPFAPDFYKPSSWYFMGKKVHASRVMTFIGRPLPDMLKPAYNFGGMSLSQLIEVYVNRWLKTVDSVNRLISNFSVSGIKTNMMAQLAADDSAGSLIQRVQTFNRFRDNRGTMLLDKDTEEFFQFNVPLAGLEGLQAQAQEHMAAPTHIPLVKLTGITPAGLNANSDGEIRVFYDWIASEQSNLFDEHMRKCLALLQLHLWGKIDPKIGYEWVPLSAPTEQEAATISKTKTDEIVSLIAASVIGPDEGRDKLRQTKGSGFEHLVGDAPEPPELDEDDDGEKPPKDKGGGKE